MRPSTHPHAATCLSLLGRMSQGLPIWITVCLQHSAPPEWLDQVNPRSRRSWSVDNTRSSNHEYRYPNSAAIGAHLLDIYISQVCPQLMLSRHRRKSSPRTSQQPFDIAHHGPTRFCPCSLLYPVRGEQSGRPRICR